MMDGMTQYDLTKLDKLGAQYEQLRAEVDEVGKEVADEAEGARLAGVPQVEIAKASRLTRERLRQIRIAREKAAARHRDTP